MLLQDAPRTVFRVYETIYFIYCKQSFSPCSTTPFLYLPLPTDLSFAGGFPISNTSPYLSVSLGNGNHARVVNRNSGLAEDGDVTGIEPAPAWNIDIVATTITEKELAARTTMIVLKNGESEISGSFLFSKTSLRYSNLAIALAEASGLLISISAPL